MPSTNTKHTLKAFVRGGYDMQKLRIMMGNRLVANFRARLGIPPNAKEAGAAKKVLKELRQRYSKITHGVIQFPTQAEFVGDEIISEYAELALVSEYLEMEKFENRFFKDLESLVEDFPIYTEYLRDIDGIGPGLAAVMISEIDISKARYPSSLWKFCFTGDTLVSTPEGMKRIADLTKGDPIIDAEGRIATVKKTMSRPYDGTFLTLSLMGTRPITCTKGHPLLVWRNGDRSFRRACEVVPGDYLVVPKFKPSEEHESLPLGELPEYTRRKSPVLANGVALTPEVMYLLGFFVADGAASVWQEGLYRRGQIAVSMQSVTASELKSIVADTRAAFGSGRFNPGNDQLCFGRGFLAEKFQEWFGVHSENKRIPRFVMCHPDPVAVEAFLRGYFDGDGHVVKEGRSAQTLTASSVSEGLIYQIQALLTRLDIFGSIHRGHRHTTEGNIGGRRFKSREWRYFLSVPASELPKLYQEAEFMGTRMNRKIKDADDAFLVRVKSIVSHQASETVYNLTTSSGTFTVQNLAVHNSGIDLGPDGRGRSRRQEHLIDREYVNKLGKKATRKSVTYSPFLKSKLIAVMGKSLLRFNEEYKAIYDAYKTKLAESEKYGADTKAHRHRMAIRFMVKHFLKNLYNNWRALEGLPIAPTYEEAVRSGTLHDHSWERSSRTKKAVSA